MGLRAPGEAVLGCGARGVMELMEHTRRREAAAADDDDDGGEDKEPTAEVVLQPMAASCGPRTEVEVALPFHSDDSARGEVVAAAGAGLGAEGRWPGNEAALQRVGADAGRREVEATDEPELHPSDVLEGVVTVMPSPFGAAEEVG